MSLGSIEGQSARESDCPQGQSARDVSRTAELAGAVSLAAPGQATRVGQHLRPVLQV
jgi:hypothetical protein